MHQIDPYRWENRGLAHFDTITATIASVLWFFDTRYFAVWVYLFTAIAKVSFRKGKDDFPSISTTIYQPIFHQYKHRSAVRDNLQAW